MLDRLDHWKENARQLASKSASDRRVLICYLLVLDFIHKAGWQGACHASASVLLTLLKSQAIHARPCIGEVRSGDIVFDHSWVELGNDIYDAAISNSLIEGMSFNPVFRGFDLHTRKATTHEYGIRSGAADDRYAAAIKQVSLLAYMDGYPNHPQGLLGLAKELGKKADIYVQVSKMRSALANCEWQVRTANDT